MRTERTLLRSLTRYGTIFVVGVAALLFLTLGFGREYLRNREIERNIANLEAQNSELEQQKLEALSVIDSLSSEYYLESEARQKRGLAKPGEEMIVINTAMMGGAATDNDDVAARQVANVVRWYYYFFDKNAFEALSVL